MRQKQKEAEVSKQKRNKCNWNKKIRKYRAIWYGTHCPLVSVISYKAPQNIYPHGIHPIFEKSRWKIREDFRFNFEDVNERFELSDAEYEMMKPALRLATHCLTNPATSRPWRRNASSKVVQLQGTGKGYLGNEEFDTEAAVLARWDKLASYRGWRKLRFRFVSTLKTTIAGWTSNSPETGEITLNDSYYRSIRNGYTQASKATQRDFDFGVAALLVHALTHKLWADRPEADKMNLDNEPFFSLEDVTEFGDRAELGYAVEREIFGTTSATPVTNDGKIHHLWPLTLPINSSNLVGVPAEDWIKRWFDDRIWEKLAVLKPNPGELDPWGCSSGLHSSEGFGLPRIKDTVTKEGLITSSILNQEGSSSESADDSDPCGTWGHIGQELVGETITTSNMGQYLHLMDGAAVYETTRAQMNRMQEETTFLKEELKKSANDQIKEFSRSSELDEELSETKRELQEIKEQLRREKETSSRLRTTTEQE